MLASALLGFGWRHTGPLLWRSVFGQRGGLLVSRWRLLFLHEVVVVGHAKHVTASMNGESLRLPAQVTASCITPPAVWAVRDRLEESETLQQQAQNNSLAQFSASPDLQTSFSMR